MVTVKPSKEFLGLFARGIIDYFSKVVDIISHGAVLGPESTYFATGDLHSSILPPIVMVTLHPSYILVFRTHEGDWSIKFVQIISFCAGRFSTGYLYASEFKAAVAVSCAVDTFEAINGFPLWTVEIQGTIERILISLYFSIQLLQK